MYDPIFPGMYNKLILNMGDQVPYKHVTYYRI